MLKCESSVGLVHVLSYPVNHNLVQSSQSLKVSGPRWYC